MFLRKLMEVTHHHVNLPSQAPWQHRQTFRAIAQFPQADEFARLRLLAGLTTTSHARTTLKTTTIRHLPVT